jgi:adenylate cyclase, class 2
MNTPQHYRDCTIKIRLTDTPALLERLTELDAKFVGIDNQRDSYFKTNVGKLKLREGNIENLITHYTREAGKGVEYTRVIRYDVNPLREEIDRLRRDHELIRTVNKERRIFFLENVKVHVDRIPGGEEFLELEAFDRTNEFTEAVLRSQCLHVLNLLNLASSEIIKTGYFKD